MVTAIINTLSVTGVKQQDDVAATPAGVRLSRNRTDVLYAY